MNVLSLFDGISCGRVALERANINVESYYASEIDKNAIKVAKDNYPSTTHVGDVSNIHPPDLPEIDLLIGGSPCQSFSIAGKRSGFDDERGQLFWRYVRLKNVLKPKYFLLENVMMNNKNRNIMSEALGCKPVTIDSRYFSAQSRTRLYWTNIPLAPMPINGERKMWMDGILEKKYVDRYSPRFTNGMLCHIGDANVNGNDSIKRVYHPKGKSPTLTAVCGGNQEQKVLCYKRDAYINKKGHIGTVEIDSRYTNLTTPSQSYWRKLTPVEYERLQGLPDNYTDSVCNSARYKAIGNGWSVDTVSHIFKGVRNG
jgi:DNA-cytosine methyltransferase